MAYLRGVFSFVLVDALSTGNVRIVQPFKENMSRGFKVFLFNVIVAIISIIFIGAIMIALILAILAALGGGNIGSADAWNAMSAASLFAVIAVIVAGLLAIVAFSIIIGIFVGFFYDFGVPFMYFRNMSLRQSIREVWRLVKTQPLEFLAYIIVRWVLELAIGIIMGIIFLFVLAIFVAFAVLTVIAMVAAAESSMLFALPFALALVAGIVLLIIVSSFITMPVQVYLRYYSLDFLKSFDPSYVNYTGRISQT
jgi:hypothetical protein